VEKLRSVATDSVHEILVQRVLAGRFDTANSWESNWSAYDEFVNKYKGLGPGVEFAEAKEVMDNYFVLDLAHDLLMDLKPAMSSAFVSTQTQLASDFKPGTEEYEKKSVLLRGIQDLPMLDVPTALNPDPAAIVLEWVNEAEDV
jgi:hypothetical protein